MHQMEQKYQLDQNDADNDVQMGHRMNRALQEDAALASLYPQLKVTPLDQAVELKRKQQQDMNQYLTKQMQEKAEK